MENRQIVKTLKLTASLMELHEQNVFKIKAYTNAIYGIEKSNENIAQLSPTELEAVAGKSVAGKITELIQTGSFAELDKLKQQTPEGILGMMGISGLGPKKIISLWKEHGITSPEALLLACEENRLATFKGFGEKTQETIKQALLYLQSNQDKLLFSKAEAFAQEIENLVAEMAPGLAFSPTGELRRKCETIELLAFVAGSDDPELVHRFLAQIEFLTKNDVASGPFAWRGQLKETGTPVEVQICPNDKFVKTLFLTTATKDHLLETNDKGQNLFQVAKSANYTTEESLYEAAGLPYIVPEMREGLMEWEWTKQHTNSELIELSDLKGILHNHSTYSDGKHTLEEMAAYCKSLGYAYLGISDHSQTAFYANGLSAEHVMAQHAEIDRLNAKLAPFRIFKGIESDILNDGSLDYPDEVLASFDFVVASVHANLKMDEQKATDRLLKAIANPYTTMLGHPTGRLLLKREGYPIDHAAIIDACAEHGVIIEINANPLRLDLDWRWVQYAMEKGVMLSINPDAHEQKGYHDMYYGVCVARKGGLTKAMTFNALGLDEVAAHFEARKK